MDLNIGDVGLKRIISISGLFFILIILFVMEKQTNYFYYLSVEKKITLLKNIKTESSNSDISHKVNEQYLKIIDDLASTKLLKINEIEKSIKEITNRLKYGKENLTEKDKEIIIENLNREIKNLKSKLENQRWYFFLFGFMILPFAYGTALVLKKIKRRAKTEQPIKSKPQKDDKNKTFNDRSEENDENKKQKKDNDKSNSQSGTTHI